MLRELQQLLSAIRASVRHRLCATVFGDGAGGVCQSFEDEALDSLAIFGSSLSYLNRITWALPFARILNLLFCGV